jgi:anaerobic magnesium-protoporphyrin IX monomethyl ester cyclase
MDKGLRVGEIKVARERLAGAGIRACYFLQFGYPGEQWEDIQKTVELVRSTRPDDIGVSFSYPLPGTAFFDRVQEQIGAKSNWTDSDDLCLMFKAAYKDEFYLALRNALHAEVDFWHSDGRPSAGQDWIALWDRVSDLEQTSRNSEATSFSNFETPGRDQLVHLEAIQPAR